MFRRLSTPLPVLAGLLSVSAPDFVYAAAPAAGRRGIDVVVVIGVVWLATILWKFGTTAKARIADQMAASRTRQTLHAALDERCPVLLHDFIVPGAYGGLTKIDYGVPLAGGMVCIRVLDVRGRVTGGEDDPQWSLTRGSFHHRFMNPLIQNQGRAQALRLIVPELKVLNLVVVGEAATLAAPVADNVVPVAELPAWLDAAEQRIGDEALPEEAWQTIRTAILTDDDARRDLRAQLGYG